MITPDEKEELQDVVRNIIKPNVSDSSINMFLGTHDSNVKERETTHLVHEAKTLRAKNSNK